MLEEKVLNYLKNAAAYYLSRYPSTQQNLSRVLTRKLKKRMQEREWELDDPSALIEQVVLWCSEHGFVDDEAYCQSRIRVGQTKGKSQARLSQELVFKGADKDVVSSALEESEHDDQKAALYYARRRGLGPFARKDREEKHDKHLASLVRAGFSYSLAKLTLEYSFDEAQDILLGFPDD